MSLSRPLRSRAAYVAHRLLTGAGTASFVAFNRDSQHEIAVPAHGLTHAGELVVAHLRSDVPGGAVGATALRLDIRREASEAQVRILSSTVHLLGSIEWLSASAQQDVLKHVWRPESLSAVAESPNAVLGVVRTERVLVHDAGGVSPLPFAELVSADRDTIYPTAHDEFDAHEVVATLGSDALHAVYAAALEGRLPAEVLTEHATEPACGATVGRIYCVDVDALGLTLMHIGGSATTVVFVPFPATVNGQAQLRSAIAGLLPTTRSRRLSSRI